MPQITVMSPCPKYGVGITLVVIAYASMPPREVPKYQVNVIIVCSTNNYVQHIISAHHHVTQCLSCGVLSTSMHEYGDHVLSYAIIDQPCIHDY